MRLLLHDCLATAPLVHPVQAGWIEVGIPWEMRPSLVGSEIDGSTAALVASAEIALLSEMHVVVPDVAIVAEQMGAIAMRVPVRPDEIERGAIRLYEVSGTAEILARATVEPFYGIVPTEWTHEERAEAPVVIVEGADALNRPEAGFSEDLVRAWFILTGQPVVSHLLVVPRQTDPGPARDLLLDARRVGHERRRELRKAVAERYGVDRERLTELGAATRFSLEPADRRALLMLLQRGNRGSAYPYAWDVAYADSPDGTEPAGPA